MGLSSVLVQSTRYRALVGRWRSDPRSCGGYELSVVIAATRGVEQRPASWSGHCQTL